MSLNPEMRQKLVALLKRIDRIKTEIAILYPSILNDKYIIKAIEELQAIVQTTEESMEVIFDATETLAALGDKVPVEVADIIQEMVIKIYEAGNFQDLTGQRISKVLSILQEVSQVMAKLRQNSENAAEALGRAPEPLPESTSRLSGPQAPGKAPNQNEIDNLFNSVDPK